MDIANAPNGAEREANGRLTGRIWREDRWIGQQSDAPALDLAGLGSELAGYGLTALTDAGPRNGTREAATLGKAHATGALPQRLMLMGEEDLPACDHYALGPLKLMIDERDPPHLEALASRIVAARCRYRAVAAHCVTATELALYLAALDAADGARAGDRIEHGGIISQPALHAIAATLLTVVTNPVFIHDRGERYRETIPSDARPDLYRAASLLAAGVPLAAGSDAPYAAADPWRGMRAARDRLTAAGYPLALGERLPALATLQLYLGDANHPGRPRRIAVGEPADIVLCEGSAQDVLADLTAERVAAKMVGGRIVFSRGAATSTLR